jgi:anti-anti-sigma regulatory factor
MAKTGKASAKARAVKLDADLRIGGATAVFEAWPAAARKPEKSVALDGSEVEKVDAAGLQALLAGRQALAQAGKKVAWSAASAQLSAAATLLGLNETLELPR